MVYVIVLSVIAGAVGLYYFLFKDLNRFKKYDIPHLKPLPFLGNTAASTFRTVSVPKLIQKIYNIHPEAKYVGLYDFKTPLIMLRDTELIKSIALKNVDMFLDHRVFVTEEQEPLFGKNLFSLCGDSWRQTRPMLSPAFTSSKMKSMFKLMSDYAANFANFVMQLPPEQKVIETKDIFTKYTNDVIATCAFGITVDSMRDPKNLFYVYGREATTFNGTSFMKIIIFRSFPWLARILNLKLIRQKIADFFQDLVETTIKTRDENNIVRPDMLQLMMETRNKKEGKRELTIGDMTSQAFSFFFGGFESTSTLMCFAAHEIAVNEDVRKKLQNEIDQVLEDTNGQAPYEAINGMEYLDAILNEALRMYPVAILTDRACTENFELPPTLPGAKPYTVKKGDVVWIPIYALQHDPKYFEDPEKFYPERFLGEQKKHILNTGAYLPFGLGPRMCIGNRFALLETKVLLFHLLARCDLVPCKKTPMPVKLVKGDFNMKPVGGFWLKAVPRKDPHHTVAVNNINSTRHLKPLPFLGNMAASTFRTVSIPKLVQKIYNIHPEAKYVGLYDFNTPLIMLRDTELIKSIALKNADMFLDHRVFVTEEQEPLFGKNLFALCGDRWRQMRPTLSPAFTSSKMKNMFKLMSDYAVNFANFVMQLPPEQKVIETKDIFTRYTNDVIATCAFGITVDSMRDPKNLFYVYGREATTFNFTSFMKIIIFRSLPWLARILNLKLISEKIVNFFHDLVESTIKTRDENNIVRPDMLQLMMETRNKKEGKRELTIGDMTSQAFIFFFGGFESTSTLMCFAAHEIAVNEDVRKKLQNEIDQVLEDTNGQAPYEAINGMEYLDSVLNEALRMYPVAILTDRACTENFELPPTLPGAKPYTVKKGDVVWIPIHALQHDPKYFEDPEKFDPERFLGEQKKHILNTGAYLPFGLGPRMCIGNRFALLETKVLLFHLLARCDLVPCKKTPPMPLKLAKGEFNMKPVGGFWLKAVPRKEPHHTVAVNNINSTSDL
ncbi:uncharacterized protein LOC116849715 [Odontomachus brunneus]|uniref:uncharacterized protein LOC116849715 n=1 Tax=Odontomachus brunneus TaxID=486640 RepID=UPI0013F25EA1|nr:uncharacterized protein LOC116849715 [Odontomachus brunneus]